MDLTFLVSGLVVSGTVIGGREYFDVLADQLVGKWQEGEDKDRVGAFYRDHGNVYGNWEEDGAEIILPSYVHMKNAKIFNPGTAPTPSNEGVLWRGKLASIDAYWFGLLVYGS